MGLGRLFMIHKAINLWVQRSVKWTLNLISSLDKNEKQALLDIPQSKSDKFQAIWSGKASYNSFLALNPLSFALLGAKKND